MNSYIILYGCVISILLSPLVRATSYTSTKVENIFLDNVYVKAGDIMQCEITKNPEEVKNEFHVNTQAGEHVFAYNLIPISGKCFSFKVRARINPHLVFTTIDLVNNTNKLEVLLEKEYGGKPIAAIRETTATGEIYLNKYNESGLVNDKEYRGFWIRWLDDELIEVGKESEIKPILSHRFSKKLQINYVGIMTWFVKGSWIIDLDPKCPGINSLHKKKTLSDCFLLHSANNIKIS